MWTDRVKVTALVASAFVLTACGSTSPLGGVLGPQPTAASSYPATTSTASGFGVVQAIDVVPAQQAGIGAGTLAGAAIGGLLGNQVGSGSGRTAATIAGAAGGGLAGRALENRSGGADQAYRVTVRMDNGAVQTLVQETPPAVQIGERVRLVNGAIVDRFR